MAPFSERAFHAWLARSIGGEGLLPIGDDVAALPVEGNRVALLTTDAFAEGHHFLPESPAMELGAAVAGASLSDLAAKGGRPVALLLDLLLPPSTTKSWARSVVGGARSVIRRYGGHLVGGDTKSSASRSVVGTALGWGDRRWLAPRSGARPGDAVVVTGVVGRGGWAARRLVEGQRPTGSDLRAMLAVEPRVREGQLLAPAAHAMIDTSDGLADATHLLAGASRVRIEIDEETLPYTRGLRATEPVEDRRRLAFYGGDYELCATVPTRAFAGLESSIQDAGGSLTRIGSVLRGRGAHLRAGNQLLPMPAAGWDPFAPAA